MARRCITEKDLYQVCAAMSQPQSCNTGLISAGFARSLKAETLHTLPRATASSRLLQRLSHHRLSALLVLPRRLLRT
jgi:hypothetical protein